MPEQTTEKLNIPENESKNIRELFSALKKAGQEKGFKVETEVVGGVLSKPWPRKDIDATFRVLGYKGKGSTGLECAKDEFKNLSETVKRATEINQDFSIVKEMEPAMDEEFGSPNILKFDGSIQIRPKTGTIIELIRKKNE